MAKDDYHVIIYGILTYLYQSLKEGKSIDKDKLSYEYLNINKKYWIFILENLKDDGLVKGYKLVNTKDGLLFLGLEKTVITPKGIDFLFENSTLQKVKNTFKDLKDIISPFI